VSAGQNIDRLHGESSFAMLCGASPIPASSGKTTRHRLNYGGDRQANRALHLIAVCRLRYCERTRAYAERRTAEGKTQREIMRCLKRYIAREVFNSLRADLADIARSRPTVSTTHHVRQARLRNQPNPHLTSIGTSQPLPAPLTIDAMADQTSALIQTLGLRCPDVLGWSMGSMIAQALAVLHPTQVRRLILCATYPGNGTTRQPSQQAIQALSSSNPQQAMAELFPSDQTAAASSYQAALSAYPTAPSVPTATIAAQGDAIKQWWTGTDPAGRRANTITIPTLIADGSADQLDPAGNSRTVSGLIHRATLELYPDAGHAFLFQDQTSLTPLIDAFLAGQPNRT
jgi:pimeloyl-ACP methyl ester carboxylesterase